MVLSLLAPGILLFLLVSCKSELENVPFVSPGGQLLLLEEPSVPPEEEGRLLPRDEGTGYATPRYTFPDELPGGAYRDTLKRFDLSWVSGGNPCTLEIGSGMDTSSSADEAGQERVLSFPLPAAPEGWIQDIRLHLPREVQGARWFHITSPGRDSRFQLLSLAAGDGDFPGADAFEAGGTSLLRNRFSMEFTGAEGRFYSLLVDPPVRSDGSDDVLRLYRALQEPGMLFAEVVPGRTASRLNRRLLRLEYHCTGELAAPLEGELRLYQEGAQEARSWSLQFRPGKQSLYFGLEGLEGLEAGPLRIDVQWEAGREGALRIERLELAEYPAWVDSRWQPLPADLGEAMDRSESSWRRSDFEVYSWNLFPELLVFDYRDYGVQAAMLRRLAFFVEKKGWAGQVLPWDVIENRHGWNAHDYRSDDLARFFTEAVRQGITLNPEEEILREILLANGIIRPAGEDRWEGVDGGLLSLARESSQRLRYLFMVHEGYHGLFFSSEAFRQGVFRIWRALSPEEQNFWKQFLDWKWYNVDDEYLLANEFMAYLMQQTPDKVDGYFFDYIIPSMITARPEWTHSLEAFSAAYPDHFLRNALAIEALAWETAGVKAGNLFDSRRLYQQFSK